MKYFEEMAYCPIYKNYKLEAGWKSRNTFKYIKCSQRGFKTRNLKTKCGVVQSEYKSKTSRDYFCEIPYLLRKGDRPLQKPDGRRVFAELLRSCWHEMVTWREFRNLLFTSRTPWLSVVRATRLSIRLEQKMSHVLTVAIFG